MQEQKSKNKEYRIILIALILIIGIFIFKEMQPYLGGFLGAFTLYIILRNQMKYLVEKKKWHRGLSATLILTEAMLFFLLPIAGIALLLVNRLSTMNIDINAIKDSVLGFIEKVETFIGVDLVDLDISLSFLPKLGSDLVQILALNSYSFVINLFVIVFVLYFMLYSYKGFENMIREILPFREQNKATFIRETRLIIKANAIGIPLLAIVQGAFAYVGYLLFGASSPMIYAVITAFATILPIVGTAIVYVPIAIAFLLEQRYGAAIGMTLYGVIVIGSVDNVVRFLLQKKLADIHPLITVFGVLVGIPMFGFWGVIFGPLILSLLMLFFNMYRHDFIEGSTAQPHIASDYKPAGYGTIQNIKLPLSGKRNRNCKNE